MADDDIEAQIAAMPTVGFAPSKYIGVPDSYEFTRTDVGTAGSASHFRARESGDNNRLFTGNAQPLTVKPRYAQGTEYGPRMLSPERISQVQQRMVQAGLFSDKARIRVGTWDETSAAAYKKVLAYANQGGLDEDTALAELVANPLALEQQQRQIYQTRIDVLKTQDIDTVRAAAHAALKAETGRGRAKGDAFVERFVRQFLGEEVAAQRTVNRAQDASEADYRTRLEQAGAGGDPGSGPMSREVPVSTPDLETSAAAAARTAAPAEAGAHDITKQFDGFLRLLSGII